MHSFTKIILILSSLSSLWVEGFYNRQAACAMLCGHPLSKLEVKPHPEKGVKGRYGELIGATVGFSQTTNFGFEASFHTNVSGYDEHEEKHFNEDGGYNKSEHRHDFITETHVTPYGSFGLQLGAAVNIGFGLRRRRR